MEGWVASGRGNKRGSKSRPGPGVANERAPAGSSRGFEQAVTSLGASRRHPFHLRSMTRPCASRSISHPFPVVSSVRKPSFPPPRAEQSTGPSIQRGGGCFCNLATMSIFSIHTISHSRHFVAHLFPSPITLLHG